MNLLNMIRSLSITSGSVVVSVLSVICVGLWIFILKFPFQRFAIPLLPLFISYFIYWSPVWYGDASGAEYGGWDLIVVTIWWVSSFVCSVVAVFIIKKISQRASQR